MRALLLIIFCFSTAAQIPGTFRVTGPVAPPATNSPFGATLPVYGTGGHLTGLTLSQMQELLRYPAARRHAGMPATDVNTLIEYKLGADLTTWSNVNPIFSSGGFGTNISLLGVSYASELLSDSVVLSYDGLLDADNKAAPISFVKRMAPLVLGNITNLLETVSTTTGRSGWVLTNYLAGGFTSQWLWCPDLTTPDNGANIRRPFDKPTDADPGRWQAIPIESDNGINVVSFGVDNTGLTDVTSVLTNLTHVTNTLFFPPGTYYINQIARCDHFLFRSAGPDAIIKFGPSGGLRASNTKVDIQGLTFEGPMTNAQYSIGASQSVVSAAFATNLLTYQAGFTGGDANIALDFGISSNANLLSITLDPLTGDTIRRVTSDFIPLNSGSRYVVDTVTNVMTQFASLRKTFFYLYDGSSNYVSTFQPNYAGTWYNFISGASFVKIGICLQRFTNSPTSSGTTIFATDSIRFLKLEDYAASFSTAGNPDATYMLFGTCTNAIVANCTFRYMNQTPLIVANCKNVVVQNNHFHNVVQGVNFTGGDDCFAVNNVFDLRQLVTDNTYSGLKYLRFRGVQSGSVANLNVTGNDILGASWGVEIIPGRGCRVSGNNISAEYLGISLGGGIDNVVSYNPIIVTSGFGYTGIEAGVGMTNGVITGNSVQTPRQASADGSGIALVSTTVENTKITHNQLQASCGVYIPFALSGPVEIAHNDIAYNSIAIWSQSTRTWARENTAVRVGHMVLFGIPSSAIYLNSASTAGHTFDNNVMDCGYTHAALLVTAPNVSLNGNTFRIFNQLTDAVYVVSTVNATYNIINNEFTEQTVPTNYIGYWDTYGNFDFGNNFQRGRGIQFGNRPYLHAPFDINVAITSAGVDYVGTFDIPFYGRYSVDVMATLSSDLRNMIAGTWIADWSYDSSGSGDDLALITSIGANASTQPSPKLDAATLLSLYTPVTTSITNIGTTFTNITYVGRVTFIVTNALSAGSGNVYISLERKADRR